MVHQEQWREVDEYIYKFPSFLFFFFLSNFFLFFFFFHILLIPIQKGVLNSHPWPIPLHGGYGASIFFQKKYSQFSNTRFQALASAANHSPKRKSTTIWIYTRSPALGLNDSCNRREGLVAHSPPVIWLGLQAMWMLIVALLRLTISTKQLIGQGLSVLI